MDPKASLDGPDLILEGPQSVKERVRAFVQAGGRPADVNSALVRGYRGLPDIVSLLSACTAGVKELVKESTKDRAAAVPLDAPQHILGECLRGVADAQLKKTVTGLDACLLSPAGYPPWLDAIAGDPAWLEMVSELWVANPESPSLNLFLVKLKARLNHAADDDAAGACGGGLDRAGDGGGGVGTGSGSLEGGGGGSGSSGLGGGSGIGGVSGPALPGRVRALLCAAFPDVLLQQISLALSLPHAHDLREESARIVLSAARVDYHVALLAALALEADGSGKAHRLLLRLQTDILPERGVPHAAAVLPLLHPSLRELLKHDELWANDVGKILAACARHNRPVAAVRRESPGEPPPETPKPDDSNESPPKYASEPEDSSANDPDTERGRGQAAGKIRKCEQVAPDPGGSFAAHSGGRSSNDACGDAGCDDPEGEQVARKRRKLDPPGRDLSASTDPDSAGGELGCSRDGGKAVITNNNSNNNIIDSSKRSSGDEATGLDSPRGAEVGWEDEAAVDSALGVLSERVLKEVLQNSGAQERWLEAYAAVARTRAHESVVWTAGLVTKVTDSLTQHDAEDSLRKSHRKLMRCCTVSGAAAALWVQACVGILGNQPELVAGSDGFEVVRLLLRGVLVMVRLRPVLGDALPVALWELACKSGPEHLGEESACYVLAAYAIASAQSLTPLPFIVHAERQLAAKNVPPSNALHIFLFLLPVYLPPPHSPLLAQAFSRLVSQPAASEALRFSLPPVAPFLPLRAGAAETTISAARREFRAFLDTYLRTVDRFE